MSNFCWNHKCIGRSQIEFSKNKPKFSENPLIPRLRTEIMYKVSKSWKGKKLYIPYMLQPPRWLLLILLAVVLLSGGHKLSQTQTTCPVLPWNLPKASQQSQYCRYFLLWDFFLWVSLLLERLPSGLVCRTAFRILLLPIGLDFDSAFLLAALFFGQIGYVFWADWAMTICCNNQSRRCPQGNLRLW